LVLKNKRKNYLDFLGGVNGLLKNRIDLSKQMMKRDSLPTKEAKKLPRVKIKHDL
jgi:hypothetical protein